MKTSEIYDKLRQMHSILKDIVLDEDVYPKLSPEEQNAIDAVHSVLYLAEREFAVF